MTENVVQNFIFSYGNTQKQGRRYLIVIKNKRVSYSYTDLQYSRTLAVRCAKISTKRAKKLCS